MKAVIFDMDGVLIDSEPVSKLAFTRAFEAIGLDFTEAIYQKILGRSLKDIELFLSDWYKDARLAAKIITIREQEFWRHYQDHPVLVKPGVYDLLDYLDSQKIKRAVATSAKKSIAEHLLKQAGIVERMDAHCYGSEVEEAKPNPELFIKAVSRLNIPPEKTCVIEDSQSGITAANRGGFVPIYIPEQKIDHPETDSFKYTFFNSLSEFQAALCSKDSTFIN